MLQGAPPQREALGKGGAASLQNGSDAWGSPTEHKKLSFSQKNQLADRRSTNLLAFFSLSLH